MKSPDYIKGFERACLLILGANKAKWTSADRRLFNKITRMLFGKK